MIEEQHERRVQTICLLVLTFVAIGMALYFLRPVLIPFVLALIFVYSLSPIVDLQMRYLRLRRSLAIVTSVVIGCALLALLWLIIWQSANDLRASAGDYEQRLRELLESLGGRLPLEAVGINPDEFESILRLPRESTGRILGGLINAITGLLQNGLMVVIFMIFIVAGRKHAIPSIVGGLKWQVEDHIKRYLSTKVLVSAVTGVLVGGILYVFGVNMALVFGVLAFLLNFIPSIGSVIATLLPVPVIVLDPSLSTVAKTLAIVLPGVIQFAVGNIIEPRIMGGSLGLHPVVILLGLMFFGMIWGITGMFLATPIVAVFKIILERSELTAPIAGALAGQIDAQPSEPP
jgi:AI-2 transport protein TqsA